VQVVFPWAEASDAQQPAGGGKKEKERQRKERQRQRRMEEAREALQAAMEAMALGARCVSPLSLICIGMYPPPFPGRGGGVYMCGWQGALTCGGACGCSGESSLLGAVEKATAEAAKHGDRSEPLAALVAEARVMLEQARAEQAERARAAAEKAEAAAAVKAVAAAAAAAERLRLEEEMAALALSVHSDTLRVQSDTLRLQQMQAQLGSSISPSTPHPDAEEKMCVVCFDAPKDHIIVPCGHMCVCEACAEQLTRTRTPSCPVCRGPIRETMKVFCS
jgi:hypothetical protein